MVTDENDELVVEVADTRSLVRCPACGHKTKKVHETHRVLIRDVPLGRPTKLAWLQRRFECDNWLFGNESPWPCWPPTRMKCWLVVAGSGRRTPIAASCA